MTTDPPPTQVIISESCTVSVTVVSAAAQGTYDTGFGDGKSGTVVWSPPPGGINTKSATSVRYSTQAGGALVTLMSPPSPSAMALALGDTSSVRYTATIYPVFVILSGTIKDSSYQDNILVGQGCTANLTGIPDALRNSTVNPPQYKWVVSGSKLQSFVISSDQTTGTPTPFTPPNMDSAHWYWSDTAEAKTITCTATVTPPIGQGDPFAVTGTKTVNLQIPSVAVTVIPGQVQLNGTNAGTFGAPYALYLGSPDTNMGQGIVWKGNIKQPTVFNSQGPGTWHFTQLITPIRSRTKPKGTAEPSSNNGKSGLDTFDPYGNAAYLADNSSHTNGDSPGFGLDNTYANYSVTETFHTYVMYQPPAASGSDSILVPLYEIDWNWGANVNIVNSSWANFGNSSVGGKLTVTSKQSQTKHPSWTMLVSKPPVW